MTTGELKDAITRAPRSTHRALWEHLYVERGMRTEGAWSIALGTSTNTGHWAWAICRRPCEDMFDALDSDLWEIGFDSREQALTSARRWIERLDRLVAWE